jgi:hypothetical protein
MYIYNSQISIYCQIANGCFGDSHLLPTLQIDANECRLMCDFQRLSRTAFLHFCTIIKWKTTELLGDMVCSANRLLYSSLGLVWISYQTVRGALLCSCRLFAPHFSAIDCLQECSSLFEELKGGAAFVGYATGRCLCMYPYFDCRFYFSNSFAVLAGHLCEFHTEQW